MKGISAVIATILLLLIAIAIMGFAFGFFQRLATTSSDQTSQQLNSTTNQIQSSLKIENAVGVSLAVRNTGAINLAISTLGVYVNNGAVNCNWGATTTIAPGAVGSCTLASTCTTGSTLKVTSPGMTDAVTCL